MLSSIPTCVYLFRGTEDYTYHVGVAIGPVPGPKRTPGGPANRGRGAVVPPIGAAEGVCLMHQEPTLVIYLPEVFVAGDRHCVFPESVFAGNDVADLLQLGLPNVPVEEYALCHAVLEVLACSSAVAEGYSPAPEKCSRRKECIH